LDFEKVELNFIIVESDLEELEIELKLDLNFIRIVLSSY